MMGERHIVECDGVVYVATPLGRDWTLEVEKEPADKVADRYLQMLKQDVGTKKPLRKDRHTERE